MKDTWKNNEAKFALPNIKIYQKVIVMQMNTAIV